LAPGRKKKSKKTHNDDEHRTPVNAGKGKRVDLAALDADPSFMVPTSTPTQASQKSVDADSLIDLMMAKMHKKQKKSKKERQ
jgi:hypothetical protein